MRHIEQAQVGRHDVADAQRHDVPGHELGYVEGGLGAVAPDERRVMQVAMKRRNGVGCAVFVEEPETDAEHDDRGDDRRVRRVARQPGDGGRCEQEQTASGLRT